MITLRITARREWRAAVGGGERGDGVGWGGVGRGREAIDGVSPDDGRHFYDGSAFYAAAAARRRAFRKRASKAKC